MENIWFTSDTHFYHKRILDFCRETRIGDNTDEMTELMIEAWNKRVKRTDRVYHTGDFSFGSKIQTIDVISRLNGFIHLIEGNHDTMLESKEFDGMFTSKQIYKAIKIGDQRIVMMHYPIESWDRMAHGTIMLHGHLHGDQHHECRVLRNRMDIGVDTRLECDMAPYHFDEVMERIKASNEELRKTEVPIDYSRSGHRPKSPP